MYVAKSRDPQPAPPTFADPSLVFLDTANGKPLKTHDLEEESLLSLAILPDGKQVACFIHAGLRLRDIDSGKVTSEVKWDEPRLGGLPPSFQPTARPC